MQCRVSPGFTRSQTPEANFSTSTRQDCAFCVSSELDEQAELFFSSDSVTHCVGEYVTIDTSALYHSPQAVDITVYISTACDSSCSEGLMGCTGFGPDRCCNYYNNSMCVDECPSPFQPNTASECVCPPGTTGHNFTEGKSQNYVISLYRTVYAATPQYQLYKNSSFFPAEEAEVFLPFLLPPTIIQGPEDCDPSYTTSVRDEVNTVVRGILMEWRGE